MENEVTQKECLALIKRFLTLSEVVGQYRDNPKMLKLCVKMLNFEHKAILNGKTPISLDDFQDVLWAYADGIDYINTLIYKKDAGKISKASADYARLVESIKEKQKQLLQEVQKANQSTAESFFSKLEISAKKLSEAVGGKVEEVKKMIAGDADSE